MTLDDQHSPHALHSWLLIVGITSFSLYMLWDIQILQNLLGADTTWISRCILAIFIAASFHCGWKSFELTKAQLSICALTKNKSTIPKLQSPVVDFMQSIQKHRSSKTQEQAAEILAYELRRQIPGGWFITGLLIKLGLLGTVIGFGVMLGSVGDLATLEVGDLKSLIQKMTAGMGLALITTIFGLICSMVLGIQYLLLDATADRLIARSINLAEKHH